MEYQDPGRHIPITYLLYSWGYLGFPVESLYEPFAKLSGRPRSAHWLLQKTPGPPGGPDWASGA